MSLDRRRLEALLCFALLGAGCPGSEPETDGGSAVEDTQNDGGVTDQPDAGPGADGGAPDTCEAQNRGLPAPLTGVYFGSRVPLHLPLTEAQQRAVVAIGFGTSYGSDCSGTLIADDVVLTAQHCTEGENAANLHVLFGPNDYVPSASIDVAAIAEHPSIDLALLFLEQSATDVVDVSPIPPTHSDLGDGDLGLTLEMSGFGRTEVGYGEGRFFVAEPLVGFDSSEGTLLVNGAGSRGVCYGDSGGPALWLSPQGAVEVLGALSWGDDSCTGVDRYARADLGRPWIEAQVGPLAAGTPSPCGSISAQGRCDPGQNSAMFCDGDALVHQRCDAGTTCGFGAEGWRCRPADEDTCDGAPPYGRCDGEVLTWCDAGERVERNCFACGERCLPQAPGIGSACLPSDCGDVDYLGRCREDGVAEWCGPDGRRKSEDCAARGVECGFVNDNVGYYCLLPGSCQGLDFLGECTEDGSARWCTPGGEIRSRDCEGDGQVCAWVDDETGFFCEDP